MYCVISQSTNQMRVRALLYSHATVRNFFLKRNLLFNQQTFAVFNQISSKSNSVSRPTNMASWKPPVPCKVGDSLEGIETPLLFVDMDKLELNMKTMRQIMGKFPSVAVRPHAKAHKCPALGNIQVEFGAVGLCCQTLTEAEAMVYGRGPTDILISNQIVGQRKLQRLAALAKQGNLSVCVDNADNIADLSKAAFEADANISCVVEVNVGQNRCGVEPGDPAVPLAQQIQKLPNLTFKGIQCYQGLNQHVRKTEDRQDAVNAVVGLTKKTLQALEAAGIQCDYVTGGGTGTFCYEACSGVFTEVQPGSYTFMDADYNKNYGEDGQLAKDFQQSLYVLSTVQSVTPGVRAVVDAGMKATSLDSGPPLVWEHPDFTYICGGDEHGILTPQGSFKVGDLVWLVPGHCDPTVNLYDWLVGVRQGRVETVWPILGRGPGV